MPIYVLDGVPDSAFNEQKFAISMKLGYGQVLYTIIEYYPMSVYVLGYHLMLQLNIGTKIKYQCTKIARNRHIPIPSQKLWQKSQVKSLWKNSFGALTLHMLKICQSTFCEYVTMIFQV